jgi:hypothetical protein
MDQLKNYYINYQKNKGPNCKNSDVEWGSQKPLVQNCLPEKIQMDGHSCNNIWNNNTKRKNVVSHKSINNIYNLKR